MMEKRLHLQILCKRNLTFRYGTYSESDFRNKTENLLLYSLLFPINYIYIRCYAALHCDIKHITVLDRVIIQWFDYL